MPAPLITALPLAPSRADDGATFSTKADAFVAALPEFVSDANAQAEYLNALALSVGADAASAADSSDSAESSKSAAAASASLAQAYASQAIAGAGPIGAVAMNANIITDDLIIPSGFNASSIGPMTTALGVTVTVEFGAIYTTL